MSQESSESAVAGSSANGKEAITESQQKIVEQVEYYFGDINLPKDRFLQGEIKKDEGWVELATMLKFKRLANITLDMNDIADALQHSKLMQVSEDKTKIRRDPNAVLPENTLEYWQSVKHRTVYVKGFPEDACLDEIRDFMKQFGEINNVVMRREKPDKKFKGSIFATFNDSETAKEFVNNETKQYNGVDIIKKMQDDYWSAKQQEIKARRAADRSAKQAKKEADLKEQKKSQTSAHFVKGLILSVENIPKEDVDLKKIKEFFGKYGEVGYVVFETGDDKAQIRFAGEEDGAKKAWEAAVSAGEDGKVMFGGNELKGTVLEGEPEEAYWNDFNAQKAKKQSRIEQKGRKRGRGRDRGPAFGSRGQKRPVKNDEEVAEKKPKKTVFNDDDDDDDAA